MGSIDLTQKFSSGSSDPDSFWEVVIGDYRYRLNSNGIASVFKGSSDVPAYMIDKHGCNCRAFQYKGECKHKSPLKFVEDGDEDRTSFGAISDLLG